MSVRVGSTAQLTFDPLALTPMLTPYLHLLTLALTLNVLCEDWQLY